MQKNRFLYRCRTVCLWQCDTELLSTETKSSCTSVSISSGIFPHMEYGDSNYDMVVEGLGKGIWNCYSHLDEKHLSRVVHTSDRKCWLYVRTSIILIGERISGDQWWNGKTKIRTDSNRRMSFIRSKTWVVASPSSEVCHSLIMMKKIK